MRSSSRPSILRTFPLAVRELLLAEKILPLPAPLLVAFSGGADSTALALALRALGLPFMLAHLNHGLRPEADAEAAPDGPVQAFAARLGVACCVECIDVASLADRQKAGIEAAGRLARYAFLERVRAAYGCAWIALGHHADDLIEDILLRLIRGSGWPALAGMRACDHKRHLIRPLLHIPRADIEAFLRASDQSWLHDASNDTDTFRRNRLRHHILPALRRENPSIHRAVQDLWIQAREDEHFWETLLAPVLAHVHQTDSSLSLPETALRTLPRAARLRLYAELLHRIIRISGTGQARARTLFNLDRALLAQERPKRFQFPGQIEARLGNGLLVLCAHHARCAADTQTKTVCHQAETPRT